MLRDNGKASSGKITRHINIIYLFIKYQVDQDWAKIRYCPTGDMMEYHHINPLQGI